MYITDILDEKSLDLASEAGSKNEAIDELVELMARRGNLSDREAFKRAILAREKLGSTGIAEGIAMPHARHASVRAAGISAILVNRGVDFGAKDRAPTKILFMIAVPDNEENLHVELLGRLSILLLNREFRLKLSRAEDKKKFLTYLDRMEAKEVVGLE